ncbi:MAG: hydroxysqualene dehydroxylase HpnE [Candidatus Bipolaricaulota bacterium]
MRAIVIGAGFSGAAAACRLAGDGHSVTWLEASPRLGGRAASFTWRGQPVDYGEHVLLRACTAAQGFLERVGAADAVRFQDTFAVPLLTESARSILRSIPLPGPAHLLPGLLGYRLLSPGERLSAGVAGLRLLLGSRRGSEETFGSWLRRHGQSDRARRRLWEPIVVATLNARADDVSLPAARQVFREALLVPHGGDVGLFAVPLGEVFAAARRYLEARGATVETRARMVRLLVRGASKEEATGVALADGRAMETDAVILAVPPHELARLAGGEPHWKALIGAALGLVWSPIVNVRLVMDRRVLFDRFVAGVETDIQIALDHGPTSAGATTQAIGISLSAAEAWIDLPPSEVVARITASLGKLLPAARGARILDAVVLRHRRATFLPAPGSDALRPPNRTSLRRLYLAGDWTQTGWPSTIEGAIRSGVFAAAAAEADVEAGCQNSDER